ncbi:putative disease resistance protein [Ananas comosus]|uniref:Putative disease resistance protein n=1 Tax=Ananas comosus TaxID=4615 RepID=A0A199W2W8_ANACO|nr:putative disease resistance protein [Ananas comosus]
MDIRELLYDFAKGDVLRILRKGTAQKIYVEARMGVGATALLQEVAEAAEIRRAFDVVIKVVRPAPFGNLREMQRAVAEQLNHLLPPSVVTTAAAFDAADEDDDFSGVEFSSRGQLPEVRKQIYQAVKDRSSVLLVLCNSIAGGKLIDPNELGIPIVRGSRNAVVWTSGLNISREAASAGADWIAWIEPQIKATALDLVYKEAVEIARYIDESSGGRLRTTPQAVLRCFWYCLLLLRRAAFNQSVLMPDGDPSLEAAAKYLVCDGILRGDDDAAAWEIGRALAPSLIGPIVNDQQLQYWQRLITSDTWTPRRERKELLPPKTLLIGSTAQGAWVKISPPSSPSPEEEEKDSSYRWISLCSPIPEPWDFFFKEYRRSVLSEVSSFFGHFEETHQALPDGFFDHFSNVRVLDLLGCIVSPINPSFLRLRNLRMLRLERCKVTSLDHPNSHPSATATEGGRWESLPLYGLQVLNLYSSDADKILLAGKTFELMPNLLELDLTENISTEFLSRSLSMAIKLKVLILTNCKGLEYLNFSLPATIETISLQRCGSLKEVELLDPAAAPLPNLTTFRLSGSTLIAKLSLQGCRKLENVDLQELTGLEVLDLSCTAIKVVDSSKLPQLKELFLLRCKQLRRVVCLHETQKLDVLYLDNYSGSSTCNVDVDRCLDSFRNQTQSELTKETNDADQRLLFHAHVVVRDVRLFRSLRYAFSNPIYKGSCFHIHVKRSSTAKRGTNIGTTTRSNAIIMSALCYADVLNTMTDRHRRHHPSPPAMPLKNHIEVDGGHDSRIAEEGDFGYIMKWFANSLFIHDNTSKFTMSIQFRHLKCFRIERCPNLEFIFSYWGEAKYLESIWLSQLPRFKALCEEGWIDALLKHIYLEFCARLEYVVPSLYLLYNLETINIRYCGNLTAIFISRDDHKKDKRGAAPLLLPKLRSIHLQELPKLQHIYEPNICAPSLEEIKIMGCFNLKKLPLFGHLDARSMRAVEISCEKDWWDKLQWDGLESNHHSFLFNPKHCPYHKKRMKARWF